MSAPRPDSVESEQRVRWTATVTLGLLLAAHTLMETGRDALFLANIPAEQLPWVYIAGALLAVVLVRASRGSAHEQSHVRRLVALQLLAAASVLGFWWAMGGLGPWLNGNPRLFARSNFLVEEQTVDSLRLDPKR